MSGMTVQTFRELLAQRPFRSFRLVMSSGQTYEVRHPEMAMLTRTDILVGVGETDAPAAQAPASQLRGRCGAECAGARRQGAGVRDGPRRNGDAAKGTGTSGSLC